MASDIGRVGRQLMIDWQTRSQQPSRGVSPLAGDPEGEGVASSFWDLGSGIVSLSKRGRGIGVRSLSVTVPHLGLVRLSNDGEVTGAPPRLLPRYWVRQVEKSLGNQDPRLTGYHGQVTRFAEVSTFW